MKNRPLIFEVLVDCRENIYILDIGVRNSGDLTQFIKHVDNVDLIEYTIKAALGEDCSDLVMAEPNGYWSGYTIVRRLVYFEG